MGIIHLISDFQTGSYKAGLLQSRLKQMLENTDVIDITHDIKPHNIAEAAFVARHIESYGSAPVIVVVSMGEEDNRIIYQQDMLWYVLPDNGLLYMMFEAPDASRVFTADSSVFYKALQSIANGQNPDLPKAVNPEKKFPKKPMVHENMIVSERIFTDKIGNCYFNITRSEFEGFFEPGKFRARIQYVPGTYFYHISSGLKDVDPGDSFLTFNSKGYLKLSIHQGSASQLFRIKENTQIIIERI